MKKSKKVRFIMAGMLICFLLASCKSESTSVTVESSPIALPETSVTTIETIPVAEENTVPVISVYETVPVEGSSDPMVVFDLPHGAYNIAPCRPAFESDQPLPPDGSNPVGVLMEFDFGEYKQEVVIAENSEYQVSDDQSLELHIKKNFFS